MSEHPLSTAVPDIQTMQQAERDRLSYLKQKRQRLSLDRRPGVESLQRLYNLRCRVEKFGAVLGRAPRNF